MNFFFIFQLKNLPTFKPAHLGDFNWRGDEQMQVGKVHAQAVICKYYFILLLFNYITQQ